MAARASRVLPGGDPNDTATSRRFAAAVLTISPDGQLAHRCGSSRQSRRWSGPLSRRVALAVLVIAIMLWIALRHFGDVLLTLVPLIVAGAVTLELMVLLGEPLNFANVIALPLLLGVGVAFKIYYIMAWRAGRTNLLQSTLTRAVFFQRADDGDGVRQPLALRPAGHFEHGQADGSGAALHPGGCGSVPARPDGGRRAATTSGKVA